MYKEIAEFTVGFLVFNYAAYGVAIGVINYRHNQKSRNPIKAMN